MKISEMLAVINNEAGRPIVKDGEKKILANPYKFICEGDEYVIYRNVEKIGITEVLAILKNWWKSAAFGWRLFHVFLNDWWKRLAC